MQKKHQTGKPSKSPTQGSVNEPLVDNVPSPQGWTPMGGTFSLPGATDPESGGKRQGIIHNTQHASALSRARYGDPVKPRGVPLCLGLCLCLCVYVSVCASPLFFTYTQRHVPKQPHNWDKCHTDTDDNILKGTDIEIHKKELQLRLLLPFKDRVR